MDKLSSSCILCTEIRRLTQIWSCFYLETEDDQNPADSGFLFPCVYISKAALSSRSSCLKCSPESWCCMILSYNPRMSLSLPEIQNTSYFFESSGIKTINSVLHSPSCPWGKWAAAVDDWGVTLYFFPDDWDCRIYRIVNQYIRRTDFRISEHDSASLFVKTSL